jgi:alcohol dehydrogenase class IV
VRWVDGRFDFTPHPVSRVSYGRGRLAELGEVLGSLDKKRAVVVTSPSVRRAGLVARAEAALGGRLAGVFDGTRPHSPVEVVREATGLAARVEADAVVSVGGGSAIDTAKGIVHFRLEESGVRLAHVAVPTTLSGGEFTGAAGITHGPIKKLYRGPHMPASLVILDPEAAAITPLSLLLPSGLNALHHCVEGVCSVRPNGMSDAMFLHAIRLLGAAMPRIKAHPGDVEARGGAMVGAALAALAIPGVPMGMGHALAHAIGGRYRTPHATTHAILVAPVMRFNHDAVVDAQASIAAGLGVQGDGEPARAARAGIERIASLLVDFGIPTGFSELGVSGDEVEEVARAAMDDPCFPTNPKAASLDDVVRVIRSAL